jgi:DNA-binding response OmpR family regulator
MLTDSLRSADIEIRRTCRRRCRPAKYCLSVPDEVTAVVAVRSEKFSTHRALVVEDDEHIAYMLRFMLERAGYDVILAANGRDAQAAIENVAPVDVVLLDLMLPYVSGYQLIAEIREDRDWQYVPIVVLSGKILEDDIVRALDLGASDYVTKPFRPEELLARLRRVIADQTRLARV